MIVHILKMCTGDAGPEQSFVLLYFRVAVLQRVYCNLAIKIWASAAVNLTFLHADNKGADQPVSIRSFFLFIPKTSVHWSIRRL